MIKLKTATRSLFLLSLCLLTTGTFADYFQYCQTGPVVYYSTCQSLCQGDDFTCRKFEGYSYWCENGVGVCVFQPKYYYIQHHFTEYFCTPSGSSMCTCIEGAVIDEGYQWVAILRC
jgi:hypothetical protein